MRTIVTLLTALLVSSIALAAGKPVFYKVNGTVYEGYYISPSSNAPMVLLIHDWDGLNDYEMKRSEMLAGLGYTVFAADLFGAGVRPTETKDKQRLTGELYADHAKMRSLLYGALAAAKEQGGNINNAVAIGYCFGGGAVLELARSGADLKGFVTFHGVLKTPEGEDYSKTKGPLLILHGSADEVVSMEDFAQLALKLEKEKIRHEMIVYGGAPHAFTVFDSASYRKDADQKSWNRFTQFLKEVLQ